MRKTLLAGLLLTLLPLSCGGPPPSLDLRGHALDAPTVYRASVTVESRLSGAASGLEGRTELTGTFAVRPVSESEAETEVLYLAADVSDAQGEDIGLALEPLAGKEATVSFDPPGVVAGVSGDEELLEAPIPLVSMEGVIRALLPPLPEGTFREDDTWTGDTAAIFPQAGDAPVRMRYVVAGLRPADGQARIEGYELSVGPRTFEATVPTGNISGEGDLDVEFEGELDAGGGYKRTERITEFDTRYIRLQGGGYVNGNLHLRSTVVVERLNSAEQFGLDAAPG
ncbi:MAG: hypothetical protein AB1425_12000 [Actinomycetota bacterium]